MHQVALWAGFNLFVIAMLAVDLGFFHKKAHTVGMREAITWCSICVATALLFNLGVLYFRGGDTALQFLSGYLIEMSLSVDNIFVFILIFTYFNVPPRYQHRVLFWGILGALIMRGAMIGAGAYLIARFHWIIYIFGAFLVFTGIRMGTHQEHSVEPEANPVLRLMRRFLPITNVYHGQSFLVREPVHPGGAPRWVATPLLVVLVLIETTDLVFAVDSIPAVFAVSRDPFIVYTSNVFAILCLRALYFLLAGVMYLFRFLQIGLSVVLTFVGVKMLLTDLYHISTPVSLGVIATVLAVSIIASLMYPKKVEELSPVSQDPLGDEPDPVAAPIDSTPGVHDSEP